MIFVKQAFPTGSRLINTGIGIRKQLMKTLTENFGIHARDLQDPPDHDKQENFHKVVTKGKVACEASGHEISDHFPEIRKMVDPGSGVRREIKDITRHACHLIAQNGDSGKEQIVFAQTCFPCRPAGRNRSNSTS